MAAFPPKDRKEKTEETGNERVESKEWAGHALRFEPLRQAKAAERKTQMIKLHNMHAQINHERHSTLLRSDKVSHLCQFQEV